MSVAIHVIVLAAGKGTRMKSDLAKVLHPVFFAPMVCHVLESTRHLAPTKTVVITGHQAERVEEALSAFPVSFARQEEQLGTGHAVLVAEEALRGRSGMALILCGDTPLVMPHTLQTMVATHAREQRTLSVMTTVAPDPTNYGRIVANAQGGIERIVEEKDAGAAERAISEVNAGIYCVDLAFLFAALRQVGTDNKQGEVYLTDIVAIARSQGIEVGRFVCSDPLEITGVNSRVELARANTIMQQRRNRALMLDGVTMIHPDSIFVENSVVVGRDTEIHSHCVLSGNTVIGESCRLEPFCKLVDCRVRDNTLVKSFSDLRDQTLG
ncbi:MAG: NTP transferase domain-containing protein [Desulfobulbaceae bacterium]|nr:NTP transferase domain-containing protein [Desulfobulbaceae bacterium]